MHKEILTEAQIRLLPLVSRFRKNFGLVGGTAIALLIGHRRSIDFDLFSLKNFSNTRIRNTIKKNGLAIGKTYTDEEGQFTLFVNNVQFTFFHYPFQIEFSENFDGIVKMPDLLTLAAMKAYALGRRAKWKDYVDLYFIMKRWHPLADITKKCRQIFAGEFNERIFREQLAYFTDINYSEDIVFLPDQKVNGGKIKKELVRFSVE